MSEQQDVIGEIGEVKILAGLRWAYVSATTRSLETFSEGDGHDAAWLGNTRFTLFRNRLDRVFACERYAVSSGNDDADLDLLYAELSDQDIRTMPKLEPGLVRRSNLNGSPGWAHGARRFLLASAVFGKLDELPWPQKSPTKQRVARQRNPEPPQPSLFEGLADEEVGGLEAALSAEFDLDLATFVVAHSLDPLSQQMELAFGRPRLNTGGGQAWHWRQDLLTAPPADGGRRTDDAPLPTGPNAVPDAPVRLRREADKQSRDRSNGDR
ncbi:hypothetical protein E4P41_01535 [Geodermatophilus sp. DF01-2]|uniref:hypothetical protein n=1 Tax=Geodermatophilus sp. DF01-2 TaxID=2559610 RepID=UPI001073213B|nr:hypothetical protein [Geodermatophilus sp. DF01_2]TFV64576.1 hypothetical protein E4P41_01535 [Geodermatophilus sp. DF01_2]